ncbi:hypothetical protein TRVA0_023S00606 [Trichomonascus vanleenenianus]|uniref:uncharacterized protein n=1 Tax=Trichomonascus vanleenenianus TaxID=2268995 RepID=UPI003EC96FFA
MDEKKFKCTHPGCNKSFNRRDYLIRHSANHLDVLPFKCPKCPQRFARADLMEKHQNSKSHEKRRRREEKQLKLQEDARSKLAKTSKDSTPTRRRRNSSQPTDKSAQKNGHSPSTSSPSVNEFPNGSGQQQQQQGGYSAGSSSSAPAFMQSPQTINSSYQGFSSQYYSNGVAPSGSTTPSFQPPAPAPTSAPASAAAFHNNNAASSAAPFTSQNFDSSSTSLFSSFPEVLPDDYGNFDLTNMTSSNADYNVSGNYAWLFGKEFWSEVYPKGASYAYDLLTDASVFGFSANMGSQLAAPETSNNMLIRALHNAEQQHRALSDDGQPPATPLNQYGAYHTNSTSPGYHDKRIPRSQDTNNNNENNENNDNNINSSSEVSDKSSTATTANTNNHTSPTRSEDSTFAEFHSHDYLSKRLTTQSLLLKKIAERHNMSPHDDSWTSTQTVYAKHPRGMNGAVKMHVFGRALCPPDTRDSFKQESCSSLSDTTWRKIIDLIPSSAQLDMKSSSLSASAFMEYLHLYWTRFDPVYPMIHKALFRADEAQPELLMSMAIVGMAYSNDPDAPSIALALHKRIRIVILAMIDDDAHLPTWILQCLLLINYFAEVFGSRGLIEMSQIFHGTHIALIRLSGVLNNLDIPEIPEDYNAIDVDAFWKRYIQFETMKRTAFFAFVCDTQQAVFYRHTLGLSPFEIGLELPCSDACWEADTCQKFIQIYRLQPRHLQPRPPPDPEELELYPYFKAMEEYNNSKYGQSQDTTNETKNGSNPKNIIREDKLDEGPIPTQGNWPTFLFSVKRFMSPYHESQKEYPLECFSPYSRCILLHGLLSVAWEMQWRGILDTGIVSRRRMNEFKTRIIVAITSWKGAFDRQLRKLDTPELDRVVLSNSATSASSTASSPRADNEGGFSRPLSLETIQLNNYNCMSVLACNCSLYHYGLIMLHEDTMMIRRFAQLPVEIVRNPSSQIAPDKSLGITIEHLRARQYVKEWASTLDSRWAVWHSMHFLQMLLINPALIYQSDSLPWCMFITILTLWAFDHVHEDADCSDCPNPARYVMPLELDSADSDSPRKFQPSFQVNIETVRQDALVYLDIVKNSPPQSLNGASPSGIPDARIEDAHQRSKLVLSVVALGYLMLQRFDPSGDNYLKTLENLLQ